MTRPRFYAVCAIVGVLLAVRFGLRALPPVLSTPVQQCHDSPLPSLCRLIAPGR